MREDMCINPKRIPSDRGEIQAPCRCCWQCRANYINDWVGRCIAEEEVSASANSVTLTYGGGDDNPRAFLFHYTDIRRYLRELRRNYPVRYFCVGEYGSKKERVHWHLLLFWQKECPVPQHQWFMNLKEKHWPHGFSYWTDFHLDEIRYVCKYLLKDTLDGEARNELHMSKFPPLGSRYFETRAVREVQQALPPSRFYKWDNVVAKRGKNKGRAHEFMLSGACLDRYLQAYVDAWRELRPGVHMPQAAVLEEWLDNQAHVTVRDFVPAPRPKRVPRPELPPPDGYKGLLFEEKLNSWYCQDDEGGRLYWSFDAGGQRSWERKIVTPSAAARLRAVSAKQKDPHAYQITRDGETSELRPVRRQEP